MEPGPAETAAGGPRPRGAAAVAAGILLSRLAGFLRERAIAAAFGVTPYADVLRTALRAPNALQVLLGEGTLSASFVPVYSRLLAAGRRQEAGRFAGAVFGLLLAVVAVAVGAGVLLARPLVALLTPGFLADAGRVAAGGAAVDRFPLVVAAVRLIFPMTGFLVLSVWALGILNSHRRFFLPYVAPVAWNVAIIAALWLAGRDGLGQAAGLDKLLEAACVGALVGGLLQLAVQLPQVARLLRGFRLSLSPRVAGVREALAAFGPLVAGRGVVQLSGYLDLILASLLAAGAVGALGPGQYLYLLPVSLFGLSVAAAELPELARLGEGDATAYLGRVRGGLTQVAFLVLPTALGYLAFGYLLVGGLFRAGRFGGEETWLVYLVLAGYSLGLPAATAARLLQNAFYALGDTRTPARIAVARVAASTVVAVPLMFWLDRFSVAELLGEPGASALRLGALGLALGSAVASWVELARLAASLRRRLPGFTLPLAGAGTMGGLAACAALPAAGLWWLLPPLHPALAAAPVLALYAGLYLGASHLAGVSEARRWLGRLGGGAKKSSGSGV